MNYLNKLYQTLMLVLIMPIVTTHSLVAQEWTDQPNQPEELGAVHWLRDYDEALSVARLQDRPIFIQFQEVPGCATCRNYGNDLLNHPLLVETIETYFVPLAVYNNKKGKDAEVLNKFGEPSWNNPVARIINPKTESDIVDRMSGVYDMRGLVSFISKGILSNGQLIPEYLSVLADEYAGNDLRETHLSMYCFWSGEKYLGDLDGVITTKAGYMNGTEVVKVIYNPEVLDTRSLLQYADKVDCADAIYTNDKREEKAAVLERVAVKREGKFRSDGQPKYYIHSSDYKYIPMTHLQSLKVNTALSQKLSPDSFLSPRQIALLGMIRSGTADKVVSIDQNINSQWQKIF